MPPNVCNMMNIITSQKPKAKEQEDEAEEKLRLVHAIFSCLGLKLAKIKVERKLTSMYLIDDDLTHGIRYGHI